MAILLSTLPVGAKVVDNGTKYYGKPITWLVGGHDHYAQGQSVLVSSNVIATKCFDAKEPTNPDKRRKMYGNNRYAYSNIRQWLNSDLDSWYTSQHPYDTPPSKANTGDEFNAYDTEKGFLTNFSDILKGGLRKANVVAERSTLIDGGGSDTLNDTVFLLSIREIRGNASTEGERLPLFKTSSNVIAYPTKEAVDNYEGNPASINIDVSKHCRYWVRSVNTSQTEYAYRVETSTANDVSLAYNAIGLRPAINVNSQLIVSDTPNESGVYEVIHPFISPPNGTNLGGVSSPNEVLRYTPKLYNSGVVVTEKFNGVTIGSKSLYNDTPYTVSIPDSLWASTKYGAFGDAFGSENLVTLEVSTGQVYTYPFTKVLTSTAKTEEVVMAVNDMSNTAMPSHKKKLVDAIGNKATIGGTGSLEDIAKAIESISVESLGGMQVASGTFTFVSTNTSPVASVRGLSFAPKAIVWVSDEFARPRGVDFKKDFYKTPYGSNFMPNDVIYTTDSTGGNSYATFSRLPNGFDLRSPTSYDHNKTCWYVVFG